MDRKSAILFNTLTWIMMVFLSGAISCICGIYWYKFIIKLLDMNSIHDELISLLLGGMGSLLLSSIVLFVCIRNCVRIYKLMYDDKLL